MLDSRSISSEPLLLQSRVPTTKTALEKIELVIIEITDGNPASLGFILPREKGADVRGFRFTLPREKGADVQGFCFTLPRERPANVRNW